MALVVFAAVLWSLGGLFVRAIESADRWTIIFWRSTFAVCFFLAFMAIRYGWRAPEQFRRMGVPGLCVGLFLAAASILFVVAVSLTTVAEVLVIMSAAPLLAAILGRVVLGEPIRPLTWLTIAAVVAGIAIMVSADWQGGGSMAGRVAAFAIAVSMAGMIVFARRHPHIEMVPAAATGATIAGLIALPLATPLGVTAPDLALLVLFGAGQLGISTVCFLTGARLIPAAQTALLGTLEPILGPLWVWVAFAERPPVATLVGGAIVIASVLLNTLAEVNRMSRRTA